MHTEYIVLLCGLRADVIFVIVLKGNSAQLLNGSLYVLLCLIGP